MVKLVPRLHDLAVFVSVESIELERFVVMRRRRRKSWWTLRFTLLLMITVFILSSNEGIWRRQLQKHSTQSIRALWHKSLEAELVRSLFTCKFLSLLQYKPRTLHLAYNIIPILYPADYTSFPKLENTCMTNPLFDFLLTGSVGTCLGVIPAERTVTAMSVICRRYTVLHKHRSKVTSLTKTSKIYGASGYKHDEMCYADLRVLLVYC